MNLAMEMLRNSAQYMYDMVAGESNIELLIDPVEEPSTQLLQPKPLDAPATVPATVLTAHILDTDTTVLSESLMRGSNPPLDPSIDNLNWIFKQQGKVKVWIYNISHEEYHLGNGMVKKLTVPACPDDAEYAVVTSLPAVMIQPKDNVDNNCIDYILFDGRRVAMDLIDPANMGIDQDSDWSWARRLSTGCNFSMKGVFFSTHNPPLKKELKAAHKRLKKYYTDLMDKANIMRVIAAAPAIGVSVQELKAAQKYVEDAVFNR